MSRARPARPVRDANETRRAEASAPSQAANHSESRASLAFTGRASKRNPREVRMKSISSQPSAAGRPILYQGPAERSARRPVRILLTMHALLVMSLFGVSAFAQGLPPAAPTPPHGGGGASHAIPEQFDRL